MSLARNTKSTGSTVETRVRFEVLDPATDPAGNTRGAGELRFSTSDVWNAVTDQLIEMSNTLDAFSPTRSILTADVSISDGEGTFTSGVGLSSAAIYGVELLDNESDPAYALTYVPPNQLSNYPNVDIYTLTGGSDLTASEVKISIRPKATCTVRVSYIAPPIVPGSTSDAIPSTDRWLEYLVLGAALKLLRPTGDATDDQRMQHAKLEARFVEFGDKVRAPRNVVHRNWDE